MLEPWLLTTYYTLHPHQELHVDSVLVSFTFYHRTKLRRYKYFTMEPGSPYRSTEIEKYFIEQASSSRWPMLRAHPSSEILWPAAVCVARSADRNVWHFYANLPASSGEAASFDGEPVRPVEVRAVTLGQPLFYDRSASLIFVCASASVTTNNLWIFKYLEGASLLLYIQLNDRIPEDRIQDSFQDLK